MTDSDEPGADKVIDHFTRRSNIIKSPQTNRRLSDLAAMVTPVTSEDEPERPKEQRPFKKRKAASSPMFNQDCLENIDHMTSLLHEQSEEIMACVKQVEDYVIGLAKTKALSVVRRDELCNRIDVLSKQVRKSLTVVSVQVGARCASSSTFTNVSAETVAATLNKNLEFTVQKAVSKLPVASRFFPNLPPQSYSSVVLRPAPSVPVSVQVPTKRHEVVIYPKVNDGEDAPPSAEVVDKIRTILKPATEGWQIAGVRKIAKGGVVLSTRTAEQAEKIRCHGALNENNLRAEAPRTSRPRIKVYDIPSELNKEQVGNYLRSQNLEDLTEESFQQQVRVAVLSASRTSPGTSVAVLEVSPSVRRRLIEQDRVYLDFASCRVRDIVAVTRCFRCQNYGHPAKYCRTPKACGLCASSDHESEGCPEKDTQRRKCVNCVRTKIEDDAHPASSSMCPVYLRMLESSKRRTDYGSS